MSIGTIDGWPVIYNVSDDTLSCKNQTIKAKHLLRAYSCTLDRVNVEGNLVMRKHQCEFTLGCFNITIENGKNLIKKIKDARANNANKED